MTKWLLRHSWLLVLATAFSLLVAHTFSFDIVVVDNTTLILLAVILISPLASSIRRIKLGNFEAEIDSKEVDQIMRETEASLEKVTDAGEIEPEYEQPPLILRTIDYIVSLVATDPVLALIQLRIELEKILRRTARTRSRRASLSGVTPLSLVLRDLVAAKTLKAPLADSVRSVVDVANRASHGHEIAQSDVERIVDVGTTLLERLYFDLVDRGDASAEKTVVDPSIVQDLRESLYELTTVVPLVENPYMVKTFVTQDDLDDVLDGYSEYAEFIVNIRRLKPEEQAALIATRDPSEDE